MAVIRRLNTAEALTFTAGGTINKGRFVKVSGSKVVQCDTAGEAAIGVALVDASSGEDLAVVVDGVVTVEAGAAVTLGAYVTTDSSGRAIAASNLAVASGATAVTSTAANGEILTGGVPPEKVLGKALEAASAAGDFILVKLIM